MEATPWKGSARFQAVHQAVRYLPTFTFARRERQVEPIACFQALSARRRGPNAYRKRPRGPYFGMCTDRFGTQWMVSWPTPGVNPPSVFRAGASGSLACEMCTADYRGYASTREGDPRLVTSMHGSRYSRFGLGHLRILAGVGVPGRVHGVRPRITCGS